MPTPLTPEQEARQQIDRMLEEAGWRVQPREQMNRTAARGVAVCEFPTQTGPVDYLLFADGRPIGVVEAKRAGTPLSGVEPQAWRYASSLPDGLRQLAWHDPLPFRYESTGIETFFADDRDPDARSRRVSTFHRPETLVAWASDPPLVGVRTPQGPVGEAGHAYGAATLRSRLRAMPPLAEGTLWPAQVRAIRNLEQSLAEDRPRALIQMATGSGKTYTAVNAIYRLIKYAGAKRVLFMVDRTNLGKQAFNEFAQFTTPDDGRKLSELYAIQHMQSNVLDPAAKVVITTVQRLYSMLSGEPDLPPELEQLPLAEVETILGDQPRAVRYNPHVPMETFDFIVIDECHRSIYSVWRQVLEYFDAYLIGLTATPAKQTFAFFSQNLVMEYTDAQAVIDGVNVDGWAYTIRTRITEGGSTVEAGEWVGKRDRHTRAERWEQLDEDLVYTGAQLDRDVQAEDQIRTVIETYRDRLPTEIFPGRREVPKTLIFAKDDHHAEKIVRVVREVFAEGDRFCQKVTYKASRDPEEIINDFRNSYYPRIAVTVDMIATGTDVRPLEVLLFMRTVRSANYFRQMRGRGTRVVSDTDLMSVTPSAAHKDHFVLVDAVGVVDHPMLDVPTLDRKRSVPLDKLLERLAWGVHDAGDFESLAVRLSRLERELTPVERERVQDLAGQPCRALAQGLLDAVDPDVALERVREATGPDYVPTEDEIGTAQRVLMAEAAAPFNDPKLREVLTTAQRRSEVTIDGVSTDEVLDAGFRGDDAEARARQTVESFRTYLETHRDEITALQLIYERPYAAKALTLQAVKELGDLIEQPPRAWTTQSLWEAYATLERDKVRGVRAQRVLTDVVSLVRHAVQLDDELVPYPERVQQRYRAWLAEQEANGHTFTPAQRWWLDRIAEIIGLNLSATADDFRYGALHDRGGWFAAARLFDGALPRVLEAMNAALGV